MRIVDDGMMLFESDGPSLFFFCHSGIACRRKAYLSMVGIVICCLPFISCGGGSGNSSGPQPDFSISIQPSTVVIAPGGTQSIQVSVTGENGFSGGVQFTVNPPSGISIAPASFSVALGASEQVTISAAGRLAPGNASISFTGTSGPTSHAAQVPTIIQLAGNSPHPPFRTRYLRTDLQYNSNDLQFFPPHFTVYDSVHKHFFVSNWALNRIDVFDDNSESEIGSINLPYPWGVDITPDGGTMYVATMFGDIYLIDPVGLTILKRYPSSTIGSNGYTPIEPFILANGELALLAGLPQFNLDGSQTFAIWDPTTNNLQVIYVQSAFGQPAFVNIGQMTLSADRSKVLLGDADGSYLVLYDPTAGAYLVTSSMSGAYSEILPTPDGSRIITSDEGGDFVVFDANTLAELGSFKTSSIYGSSSSILSADGSTLFSCDQLGDVTAYSTNSFSQTGWVPNFEVFDFPNSIVLSAVDNTGLAVGPAGHGVAFLDTSHINSGTVQTIFTIGFASPGTGTVNGGTSVQAQVSEENAGSPENITSGTVYIGNAVADNVSVSNKQTSGLTPPASSSGSADFTLVLPDGSIQLNPENFSYGPTIVELSTNAATADGGSQGVIFGYGFGQQVSDVTITVGGQSAQITKVIPSVAPISPYPFPMEAVLFAVPPGTAGAQVAVTATTAAGSTTSAVPLTYLGATTFSSPSGALMQGLYDPTRGVVYFTDQSQIDVFSISANNWIAPITISYTNGNSRLTGVGLSADGNTLAVSDTGLANVYVLNLSSPNNVKSFNVQKGGNMVPYGLVATNGGIIYYVTAETQGPPGAVHQLDTVTGRITDYAVGGGSTFDRIAMSPDYTKVYVSGAWLLDPATGGVTEEFQAQNAGDGNLDLALSGDGATLITVDMLTDANMNVEGNITYVDRDVWLPLALYGQKLNSDGSLVFQPITNGVDIHDAATGLLLYRLTTTDLADAYDELALDEKDGLLFAITSNGIVEINLGSLPLPASKNARHSHTKALPLRSETMTEQRLRRDYHFDRSHLRHREDLRRGKSKDTEIQSQEMSVSISQK